MAIIGAHGILDSLEADALRGLLRDGFGFPLGRCRRRLADVRPAAVGTRRPPADGPMEPSGMRHLISFVCNQIHRTASELPAKGVVFEGEPVNEGYGITVTMRLPGGVGVQLNEPRPAMAIAPGR